MKKIFISLLLTLLLLGGCAKNDIQISENGHYISKEEVALYIITYKHLPDNFITKNEAKKLGWNAKLGNLHDVCDGCSIGGDSFKNYEGSLPKDDTYTECDIDYNGGHRNAKRIVFSDDFDVYYTDDHYETFTKLYKGED